MSLVGLTIGSSSCVNKEVDIAVNVVTQSCDEALDPFGQVTFIELRVTGPDIAEPIVARVQRVSGRVQLPKIPPGPARVIEVRGYVEASSARPYSVGRSVPIDIPDLLNDSNRRQDLTLFMRRIDTFTPPSSAASPTDCSVMRSQRAGHTASLLPDGRVFIVGGFRYDGTNRTALFDTEFYDPASGSFEAGPALAQPGGVQMPRAFHTANVLPRNQVLIYGGERYAAEGNAPTPQATVLIFDVDNSVYLSIPSRSNPPSIARTRHLALSAADGRVLLAGGQTGGNLTTVKEVEWFEAAPPYVHLVPDVNLPRTEASGAVLLDGGVVLVAGGVDETGELSDEVHWFQYSGDTFKRIGEVAFLNQKRRGAAGVTFSDSRTVAIMGGYRDAKIQTPEPSMEAIRTAESTISLATATVGERGDVCATLLQQGSILVTGGRKRRTTGGVVADDSSTLVRLDSNLANLTASGAAPLKVPRYWHTCTPLRDGSVLVLGGVDDSSGDPQTLRDAWIYTPAPTD
jgi:hypothetical protein